MEKINLKKPKVSARDRHLKWINYYGSKNFGIWVECTICKKWRRTLQYSESHEVPDNWWCSMLTLESGGKGSCNDSEEEDTDLYLEYSPGSIVWAKVEGYPWWPGIVDGDPITDEYVVRDNRMLSYNVTFLDKKPTRAWIPEIFICPFSKPPKLKKGCLKKFRQNNYAYAISDAKRRAETAMKMTIKARLQTYSFVHLYKGRWPTAPKFEKCDVEEYENKNVEDMACISLKTRDKLAPNDLTNNDHRRIEKTVSRKENNIAKQKKSISKNLDIQSSEKKICNKELSNNGNFIPKKERLFPLMKKKDSERLSSIKKTSRNGLVESTESIAAPVQEKKVKGMKRKMNRKFIPRKEKKFDESSRTLTDDSINLESENSECEEDDSSNAVSIHEDDSSSIHASEERSTVKSNENGLSAEPYYKKHGAKERTNNVKNLNERKIKKKTASTDKTMHFSSKEEIAKHIDEAISAVLEFVHNENLKTSDSSVKRKLVERPNEQNSFKNIKQSSDKIENITHLPQVPAGIELLPIFNSTSDVNKQIISEETKLLKMSQKNMKSKYSKIKGFPKQPASYFSVPFKDSAERMVNDEVTAAKNLNKENKTSKSTSKNPKKIVILL
ncbi:unnamed protein product [Larinioides sclopetarius]|uniref:Zinc finger CW-type PWWP domain protein 1 n=1 Tax=Larinioides sclopetarius TaxID=280406 RepID=A0AAV2BZK3_9ARAC